MSAVPGSPEPYAADSAPHEPAPGYSVLEFYSEFRDLNARFKRLCTRWQVRDPDSAPVRLNDHRDADYDLQVIRELTRLHTEVLLVLGRATLEIPRLQTYADRLSDALAAVRTGATKRFVTPLSDSYHDIWMELHEELLTSLGLTRDEQDA